LTGARGHAKAGRMQNDTPPDLPPSPVVAAGPTAAAPSEMGQDAPPPASPAKAKEEKPEKKESWWETIRFFLLLFVVAVAIRSLLFAPFSIPSGSMLPNLMIGDYLFVGKWPYGYSRFSFPFGIASFGGRIFNTLPERGDIVVFRHTNSEDDWVKRVIGLPGDRIEVRAGIVILNGRPIRRQRIADYAMPVTANSPCRGRGNVRQLEGPDGPVCAFPRYRETLPDGRSYEVLDQFNDGDTDDYGPIVVPEGRLFVMGDNRDDSADSRVSADPNLPLDEQGVGLLPIENVLGRATIAFWSTDGSAEWLKPWTWFSAARWERMGHTW
jgi:signal peptidase I